MSITAPPQQVDRRSPAGHGQAAVTPLGRYLPATGQRAREIVARRLPDASMLLIDRVRGSHADPRLVAHLAADEPPQNARITCKLYLADDSRGRCRPLSRHDLQNADRLTVAARGRQKGDGAAAA